MNLNEQLKVAVKALDAKIAEDINVLKIEELTSLAEYFIICTGNSTTHVKTLKEAVEQELQEQVDQMRENVISSLLELDEEDNSSPSFYVQPNSDKDLEDFMKAYGVEDTEVSAEAVIAELEEKHIGGDAE